MKYNLLTSLFILIGTQLLVSCSKKEQTTPQTPPVPVTVTMPRLSDLPLYIESIGTLRASVSIDLLAQSRGRLNRVLIHEGQWVKEGEPLFLIDPKPYEIKVEEARAQLSSDLAAWSSVQKKVGRFHSLASKALVSANEWDELEALEAKAKATVELDTARMQSATMELEQCTVRSPIDGRVGKLDLCEGHYIREGQNTPLVTIAKLDPLQIEFNLTEREISKITPSTRTLELFPLACLDEKDPKSSCDDEVATQEKDKPLTADASITFLDNGFNPQTGLLIARGVVNNKEQQLRPGQSVRVRLTISTLHQALLIPQKTIRYNQEGPYVYVVLDDKKVQMRQLQLGDERGLEVVVLTGLEAGEQLILDGHLRLMNNAQVEIVP